MSGPGVNHAGAINTSALHIMDIAPTLLQLAGVEHPAGAKDSGVAPIQGKSMQAVLANRESSIRKDSEWNGWELFGNRAVRQGDWKFVNMLKAAGGFGEWELFNLKDDLAEMHDLSSQQTAKREEMLNFWDEYLKTNGVIEAGAGPLEKQNR